MKRVKTTAEPRSTPAYFPCSFCMALATHSRVQRDVAGLVAVGMWCEVNDHYILRLFVAI